jgi:hypothetical protein
MTLHSAGVATVTERSGRTTTLHPTLATACSPTRPHNLPVKEWMRAISQPSPIGLGRVMTNVAAVAHRQEIVDLVVGAVTVDVVNVRRVGVECFPIGGRKRPTSASAVPRRRTRVFDEDSAASVDARHSDATSWSRGQELQHEHPCNP